MIEKIGHIKNPLTVIAIFAGIAEISGTVVLPFIAKENQARYIEFLIEFPFFLVTAFFLTLNLNRKALYSPSDYKDEKNFLDPTHPTSPEEKGDRLRDEVNEAAADLKAEQVASSTPTEETNVPAAPTVEVESESASTTAAQSTPVPKPEAATSAAPGPTLEDPTTAFVRAVPPYKNAPPPEQKLSSDHALTSVAGDISLAERLCVQQLSKSLGVQFKTDIRIEFDNLPGVVYDAFGTSGTGVHAVEVKYFPGRTLDAKRFYSVIAKTAAIARRFEKIHKTSFTLHLYIVTRLDSSLAVSMAMSELRRYASEYNLNVQVHATTLRDLVRNNQLGSQQASR